MTRVLIIYADPPDAVNRLRLDLEVRKIQNALDQGDSAFDLRLEPAVMISSLPGILRRHKPHILHFAGHGTPDGSLVLLDDQGNADELPFTNLEKIIRPLSQRPQCILLNCCFLHSAADALKKLVDVVVGVEREIPDSTAAEFAKQFYEAIADKVSVQDAFDTANAVITRDGFPGAQITKRSDVDLSSLRIPPPAPPPAEIVATFPRKNGQLIYVDDEDEGGNKLPSYRIDIRLSNAPHDVHVVTCVLEDDDQPEDVFTLVGPKPSFAGVWFHTWGDFRIIAMLWHGNNCTVLTSQVSTALRRGHFTKVPNDARLAIEQIEAHP